MPAARGSSNTLFFAIMGCISAWFVQIVVCYLLIFNFFFSLIALIIGKLYSNQTSIVAFAPVDYIGSQSESNSNIEINLQNNGDIAGQGYRVGSKEDVAKANSKRFKKTKKVYSI